MGSGDFPLGMFIVTVLIILVVCAGAVLMIAAGLSEDNETGILRQLWETFFGGSVEDED